jgi:hypothetical protein
MECVFCAVLHRVNLYFAVNLVRITVECVMFAFIFRVQHVSFKKLAENLLQDDLQVANWLLHFCLRPCFHPAFSHSNKEHSETACRWPLGGRYVVTYHLFLKCVALKETRAMDVVVKWRNELVWIIKKCLVYLCTYNWGVVDSDFMLISCLR